MFLNKFVLLPINICTPLDFFKALIILLAIFPVSISLNNSFNVSKSVSILLFTKLGNPRTKNGLTGAIGVIGPKRIDYQRIVPIVNYMSEIISNKK